MFFSHYRVLLFLSLAQSDKGPLVKYQASKTLKGFKAVSSTQLLNWLILIKAWIGQDLDLALALAMPGIQYPKNVKVCRRLVREVNMYKQQGDTGY